MVKWIKANILDLIQSVGLVGVVVVAVMAWLQSVPWYLAVLGLLAAVVLIMIGINQYEIRKERHKKKLTKLSDKEIEDTIQKWLVDDLGYKFQKKINDICLFQFEVEDEGKRTVLISRPKIHPERLDLSSVRTLGKEHRQRYEKLNQIEKQAIVHNLRIEMARFGLMFESFDTNLQKIDFGDSVSLDDTLGEFYLKQRILFVIRGSLLINEVINQALIQPNPDKGGSHS